MTTFPIFGPEWLDKQLSVPLSNSFMRLDFRLVMNYLLLKRNEEKFGLTLDQVELEDFSELIETAFNATCDEQHIQFLRKCDNSKCFKNQLNVENYQRRHEKCSPTIIKWALMEASKYCLKHKLTNNESDTKQFLSLLKSETASGFHHSDRVNRQHLIVFLWYLERLSSQSPSQDLIESWFDRNRRLIAQLCLIVDRPHDSWRHVNLKLLTDLTIRYSTREESQLLVNSVSKISMSRAIQSLNTDEWKSNLRLMALTAREMDDDDLIYGLESLVRTSGIVNKNWQHMSLVKCNMDRNFEETYRQFLDSFEKTNEFTSELVQKLDQSCLIEFLDSCIELERLNQHADMLDLLKSEDHKLLLKMCIDSDKITCREEFDEIYDVVKHWVSTWTLEPGCETSDTVRPASSLSSLTEVVLETLEHSSTLDTYKDHAISFRIARDLGSRKDCILNVIKTDTTSQGIRILQRGPLMREQTPIFRARKPVELEDILSSDQKLPHIVKKFFFSAEIEGAEIPEEEVASCKIQAHVQTLRKECMRAATIGLITKILDNQYRAIHQGQTQIDSDLLNTSFNYDMQLLLLSTEDGYASVEYHIAETAATVLDKIKNHASLLSESNLILFKRSILPHVTKTWSKLKNNLVSIATSCLDIPKVWIDAITDVIHAIALAQPEVLLYECLVSRIDLQCQIAGYDSHLSEKPDKLAADESPLLHCHDHQLAYKQRDQYLRHLKFWEGVYKHILEKGEGDISDWANVIAQTETFLKEIRKISYLPGEYFKSLTTRLNRRLNQFLDTFNKHADPRTGQIRCQKYLDECRTRLDAIYKQDGKSISVLRIYFERTVAQNETTVYDSNLGTDLIGPLKELEYRFQLLVSKKTLISSELEKLIKSITELISLCHTKVIRVHHAFKQRLYLESISPFLSRLKSGSVLMPEHIDSDNTCSPNSIYYSEAQRKSYITIHKISQNVQMIQSKTAPKKISFVGSDGVTRSYLLKAHEDLRLDRLLMELSGAINSVLACQKDLAKYGYGLKRYSVTPVSNRSGLIQWVEAPSLHSFYRKWFHSQAGQSIMRGLYEKTCPILCAKPESADPKHHICKPSTLGQTIEPFYQLLWAQIKKRDARATENPTKPNSDNTSRYRQELPIHVYEDVVEQLVANISQDFIANELWLTSSDSKSYYLSTRNFIRSCAAHSIFGYIIGLGDRHLDNILLELKSGRVTHIDHNVCFEVGCDMSIPERVPFRLTQSMVRAFGFAGLEGGFTLSCQRILRALRESKHVILNHLDPENLSFMTNQDANKSEVKLDRAPRQGLPKRTMSDLTVKAPHFSPSLMKHPEEWKTSDTDGWDREPDDPQRAARSGWYDDGWGLDDRGWVANDGGWGANDGWVSDVPDEPRGYVDSDNGSEYYDYTPTRVSRQPRVRLQVHDIEEVSEDTMFLPQVLPPLEKKVDKSPVDDFQINIKTPKKISTKQAHNIQTRVREKLTGNDEQLRSKVFATKSSNVPTKKEDLVEPSKDLISLNQEALSIEDQVNCLITEALSNKNKAAMYEGWSPWV